MKKTVNGFQRRFDYVKVYLIVWFIQDHSLAYSIILSWNIVTWYVHSCIFNTHCTVWRHVDIAIPANRPFMIITWLNNSYDENLA